MAYRPDRACRMTPAERLLAADATITRLIAFGRVPDRFNPLYDLLVELLHPRDGSAGPLTYAQLAAALDRLERVEL